MLVKPEYCPLCHTPLSLSNRATRESYCDKVLIKDPIQSNRLNYHYSFSRSAEDFYIENYVVVRLINHTDIYNGWHVTEIDRFLYVSTFNSVDKIKRLLLLV